MKLTLELRSVLCIAASIRLQLPDFDFYLCSGGLELLFGNQKIHQVDVPTSAPGSQVGHHTCARLTASLMVFVQLTVRDVLGWTKVNLLKERPELFMKGDSVYAGLQQPLHIAMLHLWNIAGDQGF
jgi:hypothetical protein